MGNLIVNLVILLVFFGGCAAVIVFALKLRKKDKANKADKKHQADRHGATLTGELKHIEGLPIASGLPVTLFYGKSKIVIKKEQQEFTLECNKITSIDLTTGKDIQRQATSGAVAGKYLIGGFTGAAVGALLASSFYLVIAYKNNSENNFILLDTAQSGTFASKVVKDFKANNPRAVESVAL